MHLFNLPSISLAVSLKNIREKAVFGWHKVKSVMPSATFVVEIKLILVCICVVLSDDVQQTEKTTI